MLGLVKISVAHNILHKLCIIWVGVQLFCTCMWIVIEWKLTENEIKHLNFIGGSVKLSIFSAQAVTGYRNWPRYGLRWSGWYCNPEQHELCRPLRGRASRHNECCSGLQYQPRQRRPYKWSISILPRSQFTKSKGNLRSRRLVPLFVPIGVCVTTHDDGTASDVTIGMWRHNQQVTNHERNGKPWFSFPK